MKKLLLLFLLFPLVAYAADVIIYDTKTKEVKQYLKSVNTPDYSNRPDVLVNPTVPDGVPLKYLKVKNGQVIEMTQVEKDAILAAEEEARKQAQRDAIDDLSFTVKDLVTALKDLGVIIDVEALKTKIKENNNLSISP